MGEINESIERLLAAIKTSEEYLEYRKQEELITANPELWERVNMLRANNFRMQNDKSNEDLIERAERLGEEFAELRKIPEVNAYLDAELALCKVLQNVCRTLIEGIEIQVPEFN